MLKDVGMAFLCICIYDVGIEAPKSIETRSKYSMNDAALDLVSGTSIPTSFNILVKMHLYLCHWFLLCVATRNDLLTFVQSYTSLAY